MGWVILRAALEQALPEQLVSDWIAAAPAGESARVGLAKGAETVIPAGGIVMTLLAEAGVHEVDKAPVVNGLIALVKIAELAVSLKQLTGNFTSKRLTYAPPTGTLLDDIRRVYGNHVYPGAS